MLTKVTKLELVTLTLVIQFIFQAYVPCSSCLRADCQWYLLHPEFRTRCTNCLKHYDNVKQPRSSGSHCISTGLYAVATALSNVTPPTQTLFFKIIGSFTRSESHVPNLLLLTLLK